MRAQLLAVWSTVMMLSTLALLVLDLSVRNTPASPAKLHDADPRFDSLLASAAGEQPASQGSATQHLRNLLDGMARVRLAPRPRGPRACAASVS